jgi:ribonuclease VapC
VIVETSAVVAIVWGEPEAEEFVQLIRADSGPVMSAANYLETGIVVDRNRSHDPALVRDLDTLLTGLDIEIVPVTVDQARLARQAHRDFGKGSGHPAQLNFGDCFAYALATDTDEPLLFKGADFERAGVRLARRATP